LPFTVSVFHYQMWWFWCSCEVLEVPPCILSL